MKLITEMNEDVQLITEKREDGTKEFYIRGNFMQAGVKNRNGRIYDRDVLGPAVGKYMTEYVEKNRALGELNHPTGPTVNLDRVSHIIKEMNADGNNFVGKAKILNTPMGKIVQNLIEEGACLGVSSRGMGSVKKNSEGINEVQKDFILSAVDIVADPSAPDAFVDGIMEGREWIWDNGVIREKQIAHYEQVIKESNRQNLEENAIRVFKDFISKL
ncbi:MAG TPA: primosomal protein [Balneola sp.]|nr:primosomal protein [Balneola sp.]